MSTENKENGKKNVFSLQRIITCALLFFIVLLLISLYYRSHPIMTVNAPSAAVNDTNEKEEQSQEEENTETQDTDSSEELSVNLTDPSSITVIVNKNHPLKASYEPADLAEPYVNSTGEIIRVSTKAAESLKEMINAAKEADIQLYLTDGYISYEAQEDYYASQKVIVGEAEASKTTPKAGYSEHQTGLALDFSDESSGRSSSFSDSAASKWLSEHAYEYGFILRYPADKENITGYGYIPWHYRYVGKETASAMHEISPDLTMEEYFHIDE